AVEVFEGNTSDTSTFLSQIEKVRKRFGVKNVVWVTDRGILTSSNTVPGFGSIINVPAFALANWGPAGGIICDTRIEKIEKLKNLGLVASKAA
nr:hypothetical protein [Crocosphaera sp.]